MNLRSLIQVLCCLTMTPLLSALPDNSPPASIQPYKTVGNRVLSLHFFEPATSANQPRPCVLLIHSGGWEKGSPERYYFLARPLRDMGFVVAVMQYRLCDPKATPPVTVFDAVIDSRDALRYLRTHARELNIDPARLVACGGSAGGHLAAGLVLFTDDTPGATATPPPAALMLFNPVIDTSKAGYGQARIGPDWQKISPLHHVRAGMPPTLMFHGTTDRTVPFAGAQAFHDTMLRAGNVSEFHPFTDGDHGYYQKEPIFSQTMETIHRFCFAQKLLPTTATSVPSPLP